LQFAQLLAPEAITAALQRMKSDLESEPFFEEINTFDTSVAADAQRSAVGAILVSVLAIGIYMWVRFQHITFGIAACLGLLQDVLIVLGLVAIGAYLSQTPL